MNSEGLKLDKQRHLQPVWGLGDDVRDGDLIAFLEETAGIPAGEVAGWDLIVHSVEPPAYLGRDEELVAGPRMDNLLSVHAGTAALAAVAANPAGLSHIPVLAAFDHEENGSRPTPAPTARCSAACWSARCSRAEGRTRTGRAPSPAPSASPPTPATPSTPTTRSGTTRRTTRASTAAPSSRSTSTTATRRRFQAGAPGERRGAAPVPRGGGRVRRR
ncbi:M18 family aminopeptidase 2 [Streptomyces griseomycini]